MYTELIKHDTKIFSQTNEALITMLKLSIAILPINCSFGSGEGVETGCNIMALLFIIQYCSRVFRPEETMT